MDTTKGNEKYKVGIYARESRDEKEENYETIETQRDLLIDFVKRKNLGEICGIYLDDNVSGSAFKRRGIEALNSDIRKGSINLLVVKDLSRLGRNNAQTLLFLDFLEEYGVRVLTHDGRYDSLKDNDTVGIETWFNERYIKDISRKIRTNLRFKIRNGEYLGHAPYGYMKSPEKKNSLVICEEEAEVVREIYGLYLEGLGYSKIAALLNSKGYNSPSYKYTGISKGWNGVAVQRILTNRVYVGDTVQGVSEKISFKSKKTRRLPPEEWVITENTHEAIIDRKVFQEVQRFREEKGASSERDKGTLHALKGLVFCGRCGKAMYARKRKDRPMGYICSTYAKEGSSACTSHYLREELVLSQLKAELLNMLKGPEFLTALKALKTESMHEGYAGRETLQQLKRQLHSRQRQQELLYMDRLEGRISGELFEKMNTNLESSIQTIKKKISEYAEKARNYDDLSRITEQILKYVHNSGLTNRLIKLFVSRVTVYEPEEMQNAMMEKPGQDAAADGDEDIIVIDFR